MGEECTIRCPLECKWNKNCFVCKTASMVNTDVMLLHKCPVTKKDILVNIRKIA